MDTDDSDSEAYGAGGISSPKTYPYSSWYRAKTARKIGKKGPAAKKRKTAKGRIGAAAAAAAGKIKRTGNCQCMTLKGTPCTRPVAIIKRKGQWVESAYCTLHTKSVRKGKACPSTRRAWKAGQAGGGMGKYIGEGQYEYVESPATGFGPYKGPRKGLLSRASKAERDAALAEEEAEWKRESAGVLKGMSGTGAFSRTGGGYYGCGWNPRYASSRDFC